MALNKKPYKGTRDFFPQQQRIQDFMFDHMKKTAHGFGFEPYNGPLVEDVELYKAKSGEELINEQIYSFTDRGDRLVAIRPEMTPTLARMVASIHREEVKPIRWFSIPNLMRYEKPQKGRLREHWQFNCDIFGAPGRTGELEILQVVISLLESFGATHEQFEVLVNDREIVDTVFRKIIGATEEQTYRLYKIVDKAKKVSPDGLAKMINELSLSAEQVSHFNEYLSLTNFQDLFQYIEKCGHKDEVQALVELIDSIKSLELDHYLTFDPTIVRGLDYYTGIVFEVFDKHPDNRRAICGGGAYANLLKIFNEEPVPGVGFGLGDVTLLDFLTSHNLLPEDINTGIDLLNTFQSEEATATSLKIAKSLREFGLSVLQAPAPLKFKKVFNLAQKKGIPFAIFIGEQEMDKQEIQVKNLQTKEQKTFDIGDIESLVKYIK